MPRTTKAENNTNANILEAEYILLITFYCERYFLSDVAKSTICDTFEWH